MNLEDIEDLLSREEFLKKIKTMSEEAKSCKKKRLKTFFSSEALKSLLNPVAAAKIKREHRLSTQLPSLKTNLTSHGHRSSTSDIEEQNSSLSSESDSLRSDVLNILEFPRIDLKFENNFQEFFNAKADLDALDQEYVHKARAKVRLRSAAFFDDVSIFTMKGYRSYSKIAIEAYNGEEIVFNRSFASVSLENLQIFPNAREKNPEFVLQIHDLKEITDPADGKIRLTYVKNLIDKCIIIWPITTEDYHKWSNIFKNIAKIKTIAYKTEGDLPTRQQEEVSSPTKTRNSIYGRVSINITENKLNDTIQESLENTLITEKTSENLEKSWDFDFDELNHDKSIEDEDDSIDSDMKNNLYQEKIRSLTELANLGKSEGLINLLTKGGIFLKYGRWGKPHLRRVLATADLKFIEWWPLDKNKASGNIVVINLIGVQLGRNTKNFDRYKKPDKDHMSFSLMCKDRTLDLELAKENNTPVEVWVMAFDGLIKQIFKKDQVVRYITKNSTIKE